MGNLILTNRTEEHMDIALFDLEWNYHPKYFIFNEHYRTCNILPPKSTKLDKILCIAENYYLIF